MAQVTSSRLRRAFKYPDDSPTSSEPEAMDEEEQETLIADLTAQNASWNKIYLRILLCLPLLCIIPYIPTIYTLFSLLSVTSLLSTAYLVFVLAEGETGIVWLDEWNDVRTDEAKRERIRFEGEGPVRLYLPYMNLGLCGVLVMLGMVKGEEGVVRALSRLPGGVYVIVLAGKWLIGGVDPEKELGGLKYGYKGA